MLQGQQLRNFSQIFFFVCSRNVFFQLFVHTHDTFGAEIKIMHRQYTAQTFNTKKNRIELKYSIADSVIHQGESFGIVEHHHIAVSLLCGLGVYLPIFIEYFVLVWRWCSCCFYCRAGVLVQWNTGL